MTLRTASARAALAAALVLAGCGGSDQPQSAASPTAAPAYDYGTASSRANPEAASSDESTTVKAVNGAVGQMLADAEGRTLYVWEADRGPRSACDGACADAWPPVTAIGEPEAGDGVDASLLGTSRRPDGTLGVTYDGHPLYYFTGDRAAGEANGQGSDGFGAKWWVVSPAGDAIEE